MLKLICLICWQCESLFFQFSSIPPRLFPSLTTMPNLARQKLMGAIARWKSKIKHNIITVCPAEDQNTIKLHIPHDHNRHPKVKPCHPIQNKPKHPHPPKPHPSSSPPHRTPPRPPPTLAIPPWTTTINYMNWNSPGLRLLIGAFRYWQARYWTRRVLMGLRGVLVLRLGIWRRCVFDCCAWLCCSYWSV
jgi:hypothetical protein